MLPRSSLLHQFGQPLLQWDYLLFQGLLKVEDVALTVTPEWTQQDSSQGNLCRDEKQENHGSLVSLGKTKGH